MTALIVLAKEQLAARGPNSNRRACWLGRAALEDIIDDLLEAKGIQTGDFASGRAKLSCLEVAYEDSPGLANRAQYVWTRLSEACHQHAYALSPAYTEADHLLGLVDSFVVAG